MQFLGSERAQSLSRHFLSTVTSLGSGTVSRPGEVVFHRLAGSPSCEIQYPDSSLRAVVL